MYLVHSQSFKDTGLNKIELYNEISILVISYLMLGFSDKVKEASMKINIGLSMIILTFIMIGFNFTVIIYNIYKLIKKSFLQKKAKGDYVRI